MYILINIFIYIYRYKYKCQTIRHSPCFIIKGINERQNLMKQWSEIIYGRNKMKPPKLATSYGAGRTFRPHPALATVAMRAQLKYLDAARAEQAMSTLKPSNHFKGQAASCLIRLRACLLACSSPSFLISMYAYFRNLSFPIPFPCRYSFRVPLPLVARFHSHEVSAH